MNHALTEGARIPPALGVRVIDTLGSAETLLELLQACLLAPDDDGEPPISRNQQTAVVRSLITSLRSINQELAERRIDSGSEGGNYA